MENNKTLNPIEIEIKRQKDIQKITSLYDKSNVEDRELIMSVMESLETYFKIPYDTRKGIIDSIKSISDVINTITNISSK